MDVFLPTLNQMAFLMLLIVIGYILVRLKIVSAEGTVLLSRLENNVFIPALVLGTFMDNLTPDNISQSWKFLLCGLVVILISMPLAVFISRICSKDKYLENIYTYGLAFANFGFMGNAVVSALFPDVFMQYLIYVLPFWVFIYLWAVPSLLIPSVEGKQSLTDRLKALINPMFIAMFIGIIIGLTNMPMPAFLSTAVNSLGGCMSPIAMILTGMTIAKINLRKTFKNVSIYLVSGIRLLFIPLVAIIILTFIPISFELKLCTICALSMPLGLNTIVVPSAYGKDTSVAAGLALISHLLSVITIPVIFLLFNLLIK